MHHSDTITKQAAAATCYLDESATDGGSPTAVVGGLALNKHLFSRLDKKWKMMIDKFNLHPGLHMKDFGEHERFGNKPIIERRAILTRAAKIINDCNIYTIAATLDHKQYRSIFPSGMEKIMNSYGLCFIICVLGNELIAKANGHEEFMEFILDSGNPYASHVLGAHSAMVSAQREGLDLKLGPLNFEDDTRVSALQAADIVCWSVRRRETGGHFRNGYEPLQSILDRKGHNISPFPLDAMAELFRRIKDTHPELLVR